MKILRTRAIVFAAAVLFGLAVASFGGGIPPSRYRHRLV